jgi:hypothetical protein
MAGGCARIYGILVSPWKDAEKEHPAISPCPTHTPPSEPKPGCRAERHGFGPFGWRRLCAGSLRGEATGPPRAVVANAWPALRDAKRNGPSRRPPRLLIPHTLPSLHNGRRRGHSCDSRASQTQPPVATNRRVGRAPPVRSCEVSTDPCDIRSVRVRGVLSEVFAAIQRQPRDLARLCRILRAGISSPVETVKQRDGGRLGRRHWL